MSSTTSCRTSSPRSAGEPDAPLGVHNVCGQHSQSCLSYASLDTPTRTFQVPVKQKRVRITLEGQAVVRSYTYDDQRNQVFDPDHTEDAESTTGTVTLNRITKGQSWWYSSQASRSVKSGVTTMSLPVRNEWRCRIHASASASYTGPPRSDAVSVSVTIEAVTAR